MGLSATGSPTFLQHLDFHTCALVLSQACCQVGTQSPSSTQLQALAQRTELTHKETRGGSVGLSTRQEERGGRLFV